MFGLLKMMNPTRHRLPVKSTEKRRGVTAIEFALILPAFIYMLMGIMEISMVMLVTHLLENATFNASRTGKTGYIEAGKTQEETMLASLLTRLGGLSPLLDVGKLQISSVAYASLSAIGQPEQGDEGLGTSEQVVVYTVTYPWKLFTPLIGSLMGDENGVMNLSSRIVVRNEPYS